MPARLAENGEVSNLITQARELQTQTEDQTRELIQLRNEVSGFRRQTNEIEALRREVYQARAALESSAGAQNQNPGERLTAVKDPASNSLRLEVLEANYWTPNKSINVTKQVQDRVLGDKLELIAGNDLRGDPEFGETKTLTVVYKFDGVTMTNEVREGGLILIPPE